MVPIKMNAGKVNCDRSYSKDSKREQMVAQEMKFAKVLAGNDKKLRDKAVKKLTKWLVTKSKGKESFTEDNFQRICTGLFYCMWMSDKFLVQEEVAESISRLIHCFQNNRKTALLFIKCFYKLISEEWAGIDQHRFDKFCMLIRRFLRQSLEYCRRTDWDDSLVKRLCDIFEKTVFNHNVPNGFLVHLIDIYPEEIAKVSMGKLKVDTALILYEPIIKLLEMVQDVRTIRAVNEFFNHLIKQTDIGMEYETKLNAWKQMGMPSNRPEDLEMVPCDEGEDDPMDDNEDLDEMLEDKPMDPRAGKVDVILPIIPVDFDGILALIDKYMKTKSATTTGLRSLRALQTKFKKLKKGEVPEKIVKPSILNEKIKKGFTTKCVKDLIDFTNKLYEKEARDLEMICDEVDSDDIKTDLVNGKECDNENAMENTRIEDKKKKKIKTKKKMEKIEVAVMNDEKLSQKKKIKEKRPKSPKNTFIVEDVRSTSNNEVVKRSKKRKALSAWQIHDMETESDEYNKIIVPKIIKLEKKVLTKVSPKEGDSEIADTPVKKTSAQMTMTPAFWNKAKEKVAKKKRKSDGIFLLNPYFLNNKTTKSSKRISFALDRNEAQENDEYLKEVRNSPRIPFDASKKPTQSALKSGLSPSPINPFYRFKKFK